MNKKYIKPGILILFIIVAVFVGKYTNVQQYLNREFITNYVSSFGVSAPIVFMLIYFIGTVVFFPGTPLTISAGYLFGGVMGTMYTVVGATLGAAVAFLLSRFLGKGFVDKLLKNKFKKLEKYDEKLEEKGFLTTLFLRIVPIFPFNGLNFALGITKTRFKDFFLGTLIGIVPGSFVLANIGSNATDLRSPKFYLFIGAFILLAFIPAIYKNVSKNGKKLS